MRILWAGLLVTFGMLPLIGAEVRISSTGGLLEYSDGRVSSKNDILFSKARFTYSRFMAGTHRADTLGFRAGTFGLFHQISPSYVWQRGEHPQPSGLWATTNSDSSATAQLTVPVYSQMVGGEPSRFSYRLRVLDAYPGWVFLRVTFSGAQTGMVFHFDAGWPEFMPSNPQGAARHLMVDDASYLLNGPQPIPAAPPSGSFILYATDCPAFDQEISAVVFDPQAVKKATFYSQPNGVRAFKFSCRPSAQSATPQTITFALGVLPANPGKAAATAFYADGVDTKIRKVLRTLDWEHIEIDPALTDDVIRDARRLLSSVDLMDEDLSAWQAFLTGGGTSAGEDMQMHSFQGTTDFDEELGESDLDDNEERTPAEILDLLCTRLIAAKDARDYDTYFRTAASIRAMRRQLAVIRLQTLLAEN